MRVILHSLKTLDFFGPKINFTIKGETSFKSVLGGFVSLIVYCLYIFFFIYFGKDMIFNLNPNVTLEIKNPESQESYKINNETFFAWRVEDLFENKYNSSLFFNDFLVYDSLNSTTDSIGSDIQPFKSKNCEDLKYAEIFKDSIYKANEWLCFDFAQISNRDLTGDYTKEKFSHFSFYLDICELNVLEMKKSNCSDYKKIRNSLYEKDLCFSLLYNEAVFSPNDYSVPLKKSLKKYTVNLNINMMKFDVTYLEKTVVEQDNAIMFNNEMEFKQMHGISKINNFASFRTDEELDKYYKHNSVSLSSIVYSMMFLYDQPYKRYLRKYMKVQDVLGNVNGFMEFVILILGLINFYTNYRFDYFLFNELVNVKIDKGFSSNIKRENELRILNDQKIYENDQSKNKTSKIARDYSPKINQNSLIINLNSNTNVAGVHEGNIANNAESDLSNISPQGPISNRKLINNSQLEDISKKENNLNREIISSLKNNSKPYQSQIKDSNTKNIEVNDNNDNALNSVLSKLKDLSYYSPKRYLEPNIFLYYCNSNNNKKAFDIKLLETYIEKINDKFDVFYYLKWIRQFKNIKKFIYKDKNELSIFNLLASNFYDLTIKEFNDDFFNRKKDIKRIILEWAASLKNKGDSDLFNFAFENK